MQRPGAGIPDEARGDAPRPVDASIPDQNSLDQSTSKQGPAEGSAPEQGVAEQLSTVPEVPGEGAVPVQGKRPKTPPEGLFTDLDLTGDATPSATPGLSRWAPTDVPSTRTKRRWRWLMPVLLLVAVLVVAGAEVGLYHLFT